MSILDRIRTGAQLDAMNFPALQWSVPGLVPEGFGLLTGAPKTGKSWAVLDFALAVAAGGYALGRLLTGRPRPVLYLALEDGERRLQDRARTLLGPGVPIPANLHYLTRATPAEVLDALAEWLEVYGHERPLVVLDTLGKVMPPALPGESAYARDYRVGSHLKRLIDEHPGSTLLVVHHTRKAGSDDWMDSTSGTNGLNGAADFTLNLSRARGDDAGIIRVSGRDVLEGEYAVTRTSGRWALDGEALAEAARRAVEVKATEGLGDLSAEVVRVVSEHPDGIGPTEVGKLLGMSAGNAGTYLSRLAESGRIAKGGRGVYLPLSTPVETVESVESETPVSTLSTLSHPYGESPGALVELDERPTCPSCRERRMGRAEAAAGACMPCRRIAEREATR